MAWRDLQTELQCPLRTATGATDQTGTEIQTGVFISERTEQGAGSFLNILARFLIHNYGLESIINNCFQTSQELFLLHKASLMSHKQQNNIRYSNWHTSLTALDLCLIGSMVQPKGGLILLEFYIYMEISTLPFSLILHSREF